MLSTSEETLDKVMKKYKEKIPEALIEVFQVDFPKLKQSNVSWIESNFPQLHCFLHVSSDTYKYGEAF